MNRLLSVLSILLLTIGCEEGVFREYTIDLEIDPRLEVDSNGYYHLTLDTTNWQTLHRLSGIVTESNTGIPVEVFKVNWESSLYWELGDTLGYWVRRALTYNMVWVNVDTSYVKGFEGTEVPTINPASYSNSKGEINTMFAPVKIMIGDTARVSVLYYTDSGLLIGQTFGIVLD